MLPSPSLIQFLVSLIQSLVSWIFDLIEENKRLRGIVEDLKNALLQSEGEKEILREEKYSLQNHSIFHYMDSDDDDDDFL